MSPPQSTHAFGEISSIARLGRACIAVYSSVGLSKSTKVKDDGSGASHCTFGSDPEIFGWARALSDSTVSSGLARVRTLDWLLIVQPKECRCANHIIAEVADQVENQAVLLACFWAKTHTSADHLRKEVLRLCWSRQEYTVNRRNICAFGENRYMSLATYRS